MTETAMRAADSTLGALADLRGFAGAALFAAGGELLASRGDAQLATVAALARELLAIARAASGGGGRAPQIHVAGDRAHVLVGSRGDLHLVVVVSLDASVGDALASLEAALDGLAAGATDRGGGRASP
jgi:hypothetical protein